MDAIDRKILSELQRDGRMPNAALAEAVHLSPSPCLRRVKRLEDDGVISGYRAVLDRGRLGLGLTVFIEVKAANQHRETVSADLQEAFRGIEEIVACHVVSGKADFLLEVAVADLPHYEELLMERLLPLEGVGDVQSYFVIRTVKPSGPLPLGHQRAR